MRYNKIIGLLLVLIAMGLAINFVAADDNNTPEIKSTQISLNTVYVTKNNYLIYGKLTDEDGQPITNANIFININGKTVITQTDSDNGQYTLPLAINHFFSTEDLLDKENIIVNVKVTFQSENGYIGSSNSTSFLVKQIPQ